MNEELQGIVQKMVEAGESEDNIALVIQNFDSSKKKDQTGLDTGEDSGDGSQSQSSEVPIQSEPPVQDVDSAVSKIEGVSKTVNETATTEARNAIGSDAALKSMMSKIQSENPDASPEEIAAKFNSDPFAVNRIREVINPIQKDAEASFSAGIEELRAEAGGGDFANAWDRGRLNAELNKNLSLITKDIVKEELQPPSFLGVNMQSVTDEDREQAVTNIKEIHAAMSLLSQSEAKDRVESIAANEDLSFSEKATDMVAVVASNPSVLGELQLESIGASPASLALTVAGGVGGPAGLMIGSFLGTLSAENATSIGEAIEAAGVNTNNPEELRKIFEDDDLKSDIRQRVEDRGLAVAGVDALFNVATAGLSKFGKFGKGFAIPLQVAGEGFSEGAGQVASGTEIDSGAILLEALSTIGNSAVESAMLTRESLSKRNYKIDGKNATRKEATDLIESTEIPEIVEKIEVTGDEVVSAKLEAKKEEVKNDTNTEGLSITDGPEDIDNGVSEQNEQTETELSTGPDQEIESTTEDVATDKTEPTKDVVIKDSKPKTSEVKPKSTKTVIEETTGIRKERSDRQEMKALKQKLKSENLTGKKVFEFVDQHQKTIAHFLNENIKELEIKGFKPSQVKTAITNLQNSKKGTKAFVKAATTISEMVNRVAQKEKFDTAKKLRRKARKGIKTKAIGIEKEYQKIAGINPELVPNDKIDKYNEVMSVLTENRSIPSEKAIEIRGDLQEIRQSIEDSANENLDNLSEYASKIDETNQDLSKQEAIEDIISKTDFADEAEMTITRNELNDKWTTIKKIAAEMQVNPDEVTEEVIVDSGEALESAISLKKGFKDLTSGLTEQEKIIAYELSNITEDDLKDMSQTEVNNLTKTLDLISQGFVPRRANSLRNKINQRKGFEELKNAADFIQEKDENNMNDALPKGLDRESLFNKMIDWHAQNIDFVLGKVRGSAFYQKLINPITRNAAQAKNVSDKIHTDFRKIFLEVAKKGAKRDKTFHNKLNTVLSMYLTQREWLSNPDHRTTGQVHTVDDHLEAIDKSNMPVGLVDFYRKVREEFTTDGKFDDIKAKKFLDTHDPNGRLLSFIDDTIKNNYTEKARFLSNTIKDQAFLSVEDYFPKKAHGNEINAIESIEELQDFGNVQTGGSVSSGNLQARGKKPSAIYFDAFNSFTGMVHSLELQHKVQQPLDETNGILRLMAKKGDKRTKEAALAYQEYVNKMMAIELGVVNDLQIGKQSAWLSQLQTDINKKMTGQVLASILRVVAEFGSNVVGLVTKTDHGLNFLKKNPKQANTQDLRKFVDQFGSTQSKRGLSKDEDVLPSDILNKILQRPDKATAMDRAFFKLSKLSPFAKLATGIGKFNQKILETADKVVASGLWEESVRTNFERITGEPLDFKRVNEDVDYRVARKRQIEAAVAAADKETALVVNTGAQIEAPLKDRVEKRSFLGKVTRWLKGFATNEAAVARDAFYSLATKNKGTLTKTQAIKILSGQLLQQGVYSVIRQYLIGSMLALTDRLLDTDTEEEPELDKMMVKITYDMAITNLLGHKPIGWKLAAAAAANTLGSMAFDEEDVDDVAYNVLKQDKLSSVLGSIGPFGQVGKDIISGYKAGEKIATNPDEYAYREIALLLLKHSTGVPAYQDVNRIERSIKKDARDSGSSGGDLDFDPFEVMKFDVAGMIDFDDELVKGL